MTGRPSKLIHLYVLIDPRTGEIRYAGKANDPTKRLATHIRDCSGRLYRSARWVASLLADGVIPKMMVVAAVRESDWESREIELIEMLRGAGCDLVNTAVGGKEPLISPERRALNGPIAARARVRTELSKRIWKLKRDLGAYFKWAHENGREAHAELVKERIAHLWGGIRG